MAEFNLEEMEKSILKKLKPPTASPIQRLREVARKRVPRLPRLPRGF